MWSTLYGKNEQNYATEFNRRTMQTDEFWTGQLAVIIGGPICIVGQNFSMHRIDYWKISWNYWTKLLKNMEKVYFWFFIKTHYKLGKQAIEIFN